MDGIEANLMQLDGSKSTKSFRWNAAEDKGRTKTAADMFTWLPRFALNRALLEHVQTHHADAVKVRTCWAHAPA